MRDSTVAKCQSNFLARIIRTSSHPYDVVLDPFGGSGTTLCVAKKLHRHWIGFELSQEYAKHIRKRLEQTSGGDPIDGPEDAIESAPSTMRGKVRRPKEFDDETIQAVVDAYRAAGEGFPADYLLCDKELNKQFIKECMGRGIGGTAIVWNRLLLKLRKAGKLPKSTRQPPRIPASDLNVYAYASEVAWRLISDEFGSEILQPPSLDELLCCPDSAAFFDQIAMQYGPRHIEVTSRQYRRAALAIRKMAMGARRRAYEKYRHRRRKELVRIEMDALSTSPDSAGIFLITAQDVGIYAGEAVHVRSQLQRILENPEWARFDPDAIWIAENEAELSENCALKSALIQQDQPLLNSHVWLDAGLKTAG